MRQRTSSSPLLVFTESMLWLRATLRGASISCSWTPSCLALLRDGGGVAEVDAAGIRDSPEEGGCLPLLGALKTSTFNWRWPKDLAGFHNKHKVRARGKWPRTRSLSFKRGRVVVYRGPCGTRLRRRQCRRRRGGGTWGWGAQVRAWVGDVAVV